MRRWQCCLLECSCVAVGCSMYLTVIGALILIENNKDSAEYETGMYAIIIGSLCILMNLLTGYLCPPKVEELNIVNEQFDLDEIVVVIPDGSDNSSIHSNI